MLGHAQASDPSAWLRLLQSVNLAAETLGLQSQAFRVGGGKSVELPSSSATLATNPCFFQGCSPYTPVASSLQTLWEIPWPGKSPALRLLISDLEVNQSDISALISGIKSDLNKGATVGILALKLPFRGQVFDSQGQVLSPSILTLNRPVYLLATGPSSQVQDLLEKIQDVLKQKGVNAQTEISSFNAIANAETITAKDVVAIPEEKGYPGRPLQLGGMRSNSSNNPDYVFVKLEQSASGFSVMTTKPWEGGITRPDLGLVKLERIPLTPQGNSSAQDLRIQKMHVAGSNFRLDLEVSSSPPSGAVRATIPVLPEQWWIEWNREDRKAAKAAEKTEGLLLLLATLGLQIQEASSARPAATLCVAYQYE